MTERKEEPPQTPKRFLSWLCKDYAENGPQTFRQLEDAWEDYIGSPCPTELFDEALGRLMDTGEVVCDTHVYPPVFWPRGGVLPDIAEPLPWEEAVERGWGKIEL